MRPLLLAALVAAASGTLAAQSLPAWADPDPAASAPAPSAAMAPPAPPAPPSQVPLDGGIGLLVLAGGVYAARRLRAD